MRDSQPIVERLSRNLRARAPRVAEHSTARRAAVLVPLFGAADAPNVLFFERTEHVLDHKGEICFPGGSFEPHDDGPVAAALREAHEELALIPARVHVLGMLDDVETHVSNYRITPVVGFIAGDLALRPDPLEVARVITVPLARLLEPGVASMELREHLGAQRRMHVYSFDGNRVWGATARITFALLEAL